MTIEELYNFIKENTKNKNELYKMIKTDKHKLTLLKRLAIKENIQPYEKLDNIICEIKLNKDINQAIEKQMLILRDTPIEEIEEDDFVDDKEVQSREKIKENIFKEYSKTEIQELRNAVKNCSADGVVYGLKEMYPEVFSKLNNLSLVIGCSNQDIIADVLNMGVVLNDDIVFANDEQAENYICKNNMDHRGGVERIREDSKAIVSLKRLSKGNVYKYLKKNGYSYNNVAIMLDVLDGIKIRAKNITERNVFIQKDDKIYKELQALLKIAKLPNPLKKNEFLTQEELIGELGSAWNGRTPKQIYTESVVIKLYGDFIKKKKLLGIMEPYKFLYDDLKVSYGITKYARIKGLTPTQLARILDKNINKMYITNKLTGEKKVGFPQNMISYLMAIENEEKKLTKAK